MIEIVPAIIPESLDHLEGELTRVRTLARRVQIDVCDGKFVSVKTWPYGDNGEFVDDFIAFTTESDGLPYWEDFDFEIDLMVKEPAKIADAWIQAGAGILIFHIESENIFSIIEALRARFPLDAVNGIEIGLALTPSTQNEELTKYVPHVDFIQCMGNDQLGRHGVELDPRVYDKIKDIKKRVEGNDHPIGISVDIGVNSETASSLAKAGATKLVSGSALFDSTNIGEAILALANSDNV